MRKQRWKLVASIPKSACREILISRITVPIKFTTINSYRALENIKNVITRQTPTLAYCGLRAVRNMFWRKVVLTGNDRGKEWLIFEIYTLYTDYYSFLTNKQLLHIHIKKMGYTVLYFKHRLCIARYFLIYLPIFINLLKYNIISSG